jgi:hypothetical protein
MGGFYKNFFLIPSFHTLSLNLSKGLGERLLQNKLQSCKQIVPKCDIQTNAFENKI